MDGLVRAPIECPAARRLTDLHPLEEPFIILPLHGPEQRMGGAQVQAHALEQARDHARARPVHPQHHHTVHGSRRVVNQCCSSGRFRLVLLQAQGGVGAGAGMGEEVERDHAGIKTNHQHDEGRPHAWPVEGLVVDCNYWVSVCMNWFQFDAWNAQGQEPLKIRSIDHCNNTRT